MFETVLRHYSSSSEYENQEGTFETITLFGYERYLLINTW